MHLICSVVQMLSSRLNICRQIYISCNLFSNSKCAVAIHQAVRTRVLPRAILFSERPTEENFHVCQWQNMGDVAQSLKYKLIANVYIFHLVIQLFQLRLSPEQSGKVEYERERLLGIANK